MIIGISIDENNVYVNSLGDSNVLSFPFAVGRNLSSNSWFIGEDAKNEDIDNVDIVIDKLFYIMGTDGTARIGETPYDAKELTRVFFSNLLSKFENIEYVTVTIRQSNVKYLEKIKFAMQQFFGNEDKYKVTTYSEAFVSYIKSKEKSYYSNIVSLFDFTEKALTYYELVRYVDDNNIEYWKVNTEEHLALPLDLLSGDAGKKVCDKILFDFAKKCIKEETYNHIILSGLGFEDSSYYREFMTFVCSIANVETDVYFFSKSSALLSNDVINDNFEKNVMLITDARTTASIRMNAIVNQTKTKIELIKPGEEWFNLKDNFFDVILEDDREIKIEILKVIERVIKEVPIAIPEKIELRKDKTNLFEMGFNFVEQNLVQISLADKGFGEFYESSKESTSKPVEI
ncbi:MAG: hypothetical protein IKI71_01560 [Lachnospiraceae bacterium]|nr:hypothetical protein [Lachnospiraceae bacterium]